jgi:hypothetical protein
MSSAEVTAEISCSAAQAATNCSATRAGMR